MTDYISRADAIRVISEEYHNRGGNFDGLDAIRELETLPSKGGDAEVNETKSPYMQQSRHDDGKDLINRADAIEAVEQAILNHDSAIMRITSLPSADAVQGEWHQISPARIYECSICNHNVLTDYIDTYNYCPNCGARMKGGAE